MLIPEVILNYTVKTAIEIINLDWESNTDKTKTILYDLLGKDDNGFKLQLNKFNYFEQGQSIFLKSKGESRRLQVTLGYNIERVGLPTIHILLPQENEKEKGLGMGEGYQDYEIDEIEGTYKRNFTNVYDSTYSLMITSDNSSEVSLIYHVLKSVLFCSFEHLEHMGIRDPKFGGQDLQFANDLVPTTVFHKNLTIQMFYETTVNELLSQKLARSLTFEGIIQQQTNI